jgi:hypothetical protein
VQPDQGKAEVITDVAIWQRSHRTRTFPKPTSERNAQTLGFSTSVSRNLGLPEPLGFGKTGLGDV